MGWWMGGWVEIDGYLSIYLSIYAKRLDGLMKENERHDS